MKWNEIDIIPYILYDNMTSQKFVIVSPFRWSIRSWAHYKFTVCIMVSLKTDCIVNRTIVILKALTEINVRLFFFSSSFLERSTRCSVTYACKSVLSVSRSNGDLFLLSQLLNYDFRNRLDEKFTRSATTQNARPPSIWRWIPCVHFDSQNGDLDRRV